MTSKNTSDWASAVRDLAPYLALGSQLAAAVLLGVGVGYWADRAFGTGPWLLLLGGIAGVASAMLHLYRIERERK